jgi:hypothetical protein
MRAFELSLDPSGGRRRNRLGSDAGTALMPPLVSSRSPEVPQMLVNYLA